jgi:hypothetical protein
MLGFHETLVNYRVAAQLVASLVVLSSTELVSWLVLHPLTGYLILLAYDQNVRFRSIEKAIEPIAIRTYRLPARIGSKIILHKLFRVTLLINSVQERSCQNIFSHLKQLKELPYVYDCVVIP